MKTFVKSTLQFILIIYALTLFTNKAYAQVNLDSGLVASYPFNGNANDESVNGNNGTVNGATLTQDRFGVAGKAYYFANSDTINCGIIPVFETNVFSISVWVLEEDILDNGAILGTSRHFSGSDGFTITYYPSTQYLQYIGQSYPPAGVNNLILNNGIWHNIVITTNGTTSELFINGVLKSTASSQYTSNNQIFLIGNSLSVADVSFLGKIDDIRIYNRALNQAEIDSLYHMGGWPLQTGLNIENTIITPVSCNGLSNGGAKVIPDGGTAPYTYKWSTGATIDSISAVVAGYYNITVFDNAGDSVFTTISIPEPLALSASNTSRTDVSCYGGSNGGGTVTPIGGIAPYAYSWPGGNTTASDTNLTAGNYMVSISDFNGCNYSHPVVITQPDSITVNAYTSPGTCTGTSGTIELLNTGGVTPYNFAWSGSVTMTEMIDWSDVLFSALPGLYTLTLTDTNGCIKTVPVTVDGFVNIPDTNFKNYLLADININTNQDSEIQCWEAAAFTGGLFMTESPVADLTGLEAFTSLTGLDISFTAVTNLNISANTALETLDCRGLGLTTIDLSANTFLMTLNCSENNLTNLDVSKNTLLEVLNCSQNQLSVLNITMLSNLYDLNCSLNLLSSLNLTNNLNLTSLSCNSNSILSLNLAPLYQLSVVSCNTNQLTSLDLSSNTALTSFDCSANNLSMLNVQNGNNTAISWANMQNNTNLTCIQVNDISWASSNWYINGSETFSDMSCGYACIVTIPDAGFKNALLTNQLINTDQNNEISCTEASAYTGTINVQSLGIYDLTGIEAFINITSLDCHYNNLTSLNVSSNIAITDLNCAGNQITSLDVSYNTALTSLTCNGNQLSTIDLTSNSSLNLLSCGGNLFTSLNLSANTNLTVLHCGVNKLTSLDLSNNASLGQLYCYDNLLTSIDVSMLTGLYYLECWTNNLNILKVNNGNNTNFIVFDAHNNPYLSCIQVDSTAFSTSNWTNKDAGASFSEDCSVAWCAVNIPDMNFKTYLLGNTSINLNSDNEIQCTEAAAFSGTIAVISSEINDLTGIEAFPSITSLYCSGNSLTSLNLTSNTALQYLECFGNQISSLNLSQNTSLVHLACSNNNLSTIDVSANTGLNHISILGNQLTSLDVSNNLSLNALYCSYNSIANLNLTANSALQYLDCSSNLLTNLDLSANTALTYLHCNNNQLSSLNVKNGNNVNFTTFDANNNPSLSCIQVDNAAFSTANWTSIDAGVQFRINCSGCSVTAEHTISVCDGQPYIIGSNFYSLPGTYTDTLISTAGCDSIVTTHLFVVPSGQTVTDTINGFVHDGRDCQNYPIVKIGNQWWMKKNLNTTKYANGSGIPNVTDNGDWTLQTSGAMSYYNNDTINNNANGAIYNWYAVNDSRGICPQGWHVPTDENWHQLALSLDQSAVLADPESYFGGGMLKSLDYWNSPNAGANNSTGFSGIPAGYRNFGNGGFSNSGWYGYFWTSTENSELTSNGLSRMLSFDNAYLSRGEYSKNTGMSVRCEYNLAPQCENVTAENTISICDGQTYYVGTNAHLLAGTYIDTLLTSAGCDSIITTHLFVIPAGQTVTDTINGFIHDGRDCQNYPIVKIGTQWWMKKNLNTTKYADGSDIPNVTDNTAWSNLTTSALSYYNNDSALYASTYGPLYNWHAVADSRGVCPNGWHVPSDEEWKSLEISLGMSQTDADNMNWRGSDQGNQLKEEGQQHWAYGNNGNNSTGFSCRGASYRDYSGSYDMIKQIAIFWVSSFYDNDHLFTRALMNDNSQINRSYGPFNSGLSVRCLYTQTPLCTSVTVNIDTTLCNGQSYVVGTNTHLTSGTYNDTLQTTLGCDSIIISNLVVNNPTNSNIYTTACGSYILNGQVYDTTGIYTQIIQNAAGCDSTITLDLTVNYPTTSELTISSCGSLILNGSLYNVSGTYTQTIQNASGCDSVITVHVTINEIPYVNLGNDITACASATINAVPSGGSIPYSYLWSNGNTTSSLNTTISGQYSVNVADANGCSTSDTVLININPVPQVSAGADVTMCAGTYVTINGDAFGNSFTWSPTTFLDNPTIVNPTASPNTNTSYIISVSDLNGCVNSDTVNVIVNPAPLVSAGIDQSVCFGASVTLSGTGDASTYSWNNGISDGVSFVPAISSSYVLTGTSLTGCSASDTVFVTVNTIPQVSAGADVTMCAGTSVTINGDAFGNSFTWSPTTFLDNPTVVNPVASPLTNTSYVISVSDLNGCVNSDTVNVIVNVIPQASFTGLPAAICNTQQYIMLIGNHTPSGIFSGAGILNNAFNPEVAGVGSHFITYTYTDANNCSKADSQMVVVNPKPSAVINSLTPTSCGNTNGSISIAGTSGSGTYSYMWSNGANTSSLTNLGSGVLLLTITDSNGCSDDFTFSITSSDGPVITVNSSTPATCNFAYDGTADITVTGGTAPYTYMWSNNETTQDAAQLCQGANTVTVTDDNLCTSVAVINTGSAFGSPAIFGRISYYGGYIDGQFATLKIFSLTHNSSGGYDTTSRESVIGSDGSYVLYNFQPGEYILKVLLHSHPYDRLLNSYYTTSATSTHKWAEATPITLACAQDIEANIMMYEHLNNGNGNGQVEGKIVKNNGGGAKSSKGIRINQNKADGEPIPGAEIYVELEPDDQPVANTTTDAQGMYSVTGLANGDYSIRVEIPGFPMVSTYTVPISATDTAFSNLNFIVDFTADSGLIDTATQVTLVNNTTSTIDYVSIYPNPFTEKITISYTLSGKSKVKTDLYDAGGKLISVINNSTMERGSFTNEIVANSLGLKPGNYYLSLQINNNIILKKIIVIE